MAKDTIPARDFKRNKEEKATRLKARCFDVVFYPGKTETSRFAVVVRKDYGSAVERNKARRRLKELFRKSKPWLRGSFDIIVFVRPELKKLSFQEMGREWIKTLREGGIFEENHGSYNKNDKSLS